MLEGLEDRIAYFTFFPVFFPLFCALYILAYWFVFRNWSPKHRAEASSCFISLAHGTPAVILAALAIPTHEGQGFAAHNTNFQNMVLDFSISYFTMDLLHYLLFIHGEYLFIAHHIATLYVFLTCRYLALHGAYSLLVLLILAEATSFLQNGWTLSAMKKAESKLAARMYSALSPMFYSLYTITRGFLGPVFFFQMSSFYMKGKAVGAISWWVSLSWVVVVGGAISISISWITTHWIELYKERVVPTQKEKKI